MLGIRTFTLNITGPHLSEMMERFKNDPSSDNWMLVTRAMKAHQMAVHASDDELWTFLEDTRRCETVEALVILFDTRSVALTRELTDGGIRLIRARPQ